jgi:large conductance mechanosensitive channel
MFKEFREFISRGNVVDLATAVVIGAAFGRIIDSFVKDIIMPPVGLVLGNVDFTNLFINLSATDYQTLADAQRAGAPTVNYGLFLNHVITFVIVAFVIFLMIRQLNRSRRAAEAAAPTTVACPHCTMPIPVGAKRCPHCTSSLV